MNDNNKFPRTWEQAINDTEIIRIASMPNGYSKEHIAQYNEAAKLMAERYEQRIAELEEKFRLMINKSFNEVWNRNNANKRIAELESALKTIKELGQNPNDSNCLLAAQIANNLLS